MKRFLLTAFVFVAGLSLLGFAPGKSEKKKFKGYKKAGNGSYFRLVTKGTGKEAADTGGAVFMKIKFLTENDSAFINLNEVVHAPSFPMRVNKSQYKGDFLDLFTRLHAGDSARFFMRLDSLKKHYPNEFDFHNPQYDTMKYVGMAVKIDSIYSREKVTELQKKQEETQRVKQAKMQEEERVMAPVREQAAAREPYLKANDDSLLTPFLVRNGFISPPDDNGIYFKQLAPGSGEQLKYGNTVSLLYTGSYLDGTIFDSNQLVPGQELLTFHFEPGLMVPGFAYSLMQMRKGGKAVFVLPPKMGYNDGLTRVFEVEIVDVQ